MSHIKRNFREIEKELTVDTEYLDMMGRDMMCAYQLGIYGPRPEWTSQKNKSRFIGPWIPLNSSMV